MAPLYREFGHVRKCLQGPQRWLTLMIILAPLAMITGGVAQAESRLINGAGATFPYPIYSKWFSEYQKRSPQTRINYQSIGSGGGVRQFLDRTIDFGASDAPMSDEQLARAPAPVLHVPTVMGAVVLTYHLPGITQPIKLSGPVVAAIFLGKIKQWNDPALTALNPGVALPATPMMVVHRSDGSGTTSVFVDYLSKVSPEWKSQVGQGTSVRWPTGLGGRGNEGVTGLVKQTPGAIGYVELVYAESNKLPAAQLQNAAGKFVTPSVSSVTAAAQGVEIPADYRVSITNSPAKTAYPISALTYLLVFQTMKAPHGSEFKRFLAWALNEGQAMAASLSYAPLPEKLAARVRKSISEIREDAAR